VGVPQDVAGVVVGVGVERLADRGVSFLVAGETGQAGPAWVAEVRGAVLVGASVDGAEGRGGQGGEDSRVGADDVGHSLVAAEQPGADEVEGVLSVGLGAGRAA
jgi:hypothetical protein